jgi:allantoate deiminase
MTSTYDAAAHTVLERCDLLATFSEESARLTRRFATPPMHQVHAQLRDWLRAIDMTVEVDAMGNLIGRREAAQPGAATLLLGSHLDTVRDAGKYDGMLGVMVALACLERLHACGARLPFAIELLGFADEEGLRYQSIYMGSKAVTGCFAVHDLDLLDEQGISLAEALRAFGCQPDPVVLTTPRWSAQELLGYCEVHIEQGPVLEAHDLPLAVVTAIVGQQRLLFQLSGVPGHAGTLPMEARHDALCAAAEFVLAVERLASATPGLVATVGQLQVEPGAANVVPGRVSLSLDVRHEADALRTGYAADLCEQATLICTKRGVHLTWQPVQASQTVLCAPHMQRRWQQALALEGYPVFQLASGAGHDAVAMSALTDVSMLFVRCRGGVSHHPAEAVQVADVAAALAVLERFVWLTAQEVER